MQRIGAVAAHDTRGEKQIFPKQTSATIPSKIAKHLGQDAPLYWQEYKSSEFFSQLFDDFDISAVFDLTPGSGACAEAAMGSGVKCACTTVHKLLASWLGNVLDQGVLKHIVKHGTPLYQADLARHILSHFEDVVVAAEHAGEDAMELSSDEEATA
jgi:hypothetical protein